VSAWSALADVARDRLAELDADARAAVVDLLRDQAKSGTLEDEERELCGWAADADDAAPLRDRWGRELAARVREVAAPILAWDADRQRIVNEWATPRGALTKRPTLKIGPLGVSLDLQTDVDPGPRPALPPPPVDAADPDALAAGWPVAAAVMLAALQPDTLAKVRAKIDAGEGWGAAGTAGMGGREGSAWAWLGGASAAEPDDGPARDGWRVVARWRLKLPAEVVDGLALPDGFDRRTLTMGQRVMRPMEPPRYLRALALDRWRERWGEEGRRAYRRAPALLMPVHVGVGDAMRALGRPRQDPQQPLPGLVAVRSEALPVLEEALARAAEVSPVLAHRLIRWIVMAAARVDAGDGMRVELAPGAWGQKSTGRNQELFIEGGRGHLLTVVGASSKKEDPKVILDILMTHGVKYGGPHGEGGGALLWWNDGTGYGHGKKKLLTITVGPALRPGLASDPRLSLEDRVLVPTLPLPPMPHVRWAGPLAMADWLATARLTAMRDEVRMYGAAAIEWRKIADAAGCSQKAMDAGLTLWQSKGRWRTVKGRWALGDGPDEARAMRFLLDGAQRSAGAREAGRMGARRRHSRLTGGRD
jgi:hypothetical protein